MNKNLHNYAMNLIDITNNNMNNSDILSEELNSKNIPEDLSVSAESSKLYVEEDGSLRIKIDVIVKERKEEFLNE